MDVKVRRFLRYCMLYRYHRRFIEVANSQFISKMNADERKVVFQNMIDLYKETWQGKSKPFKIDDPKLVSKYNLSESNGEIQANRFITSQPIEFVDANGRVQFNRRKLNELPQFLGQLTSSLAIPIAAEEVFFNYSFMRKVFVRYEKEETTYSSMTSSLYFRCSSCVFHIQ